MDDVLGGDRRWEETELTACRWRVQPVRMFEPTPKGKGQSDFSDWPLFYAGNDLRSHTLGACSTIGPAGLNFRVRDGNGWIPRGKITDNLRRLEGVSARLLRAGAFCRNPEPRFLRRRISTPTGSSELRAMSFELDSFRRMQSSPSLERIVAANFSKRPAHRTPATPGSGVSPKLVARSPELISKIMRTMPHY